jgi:hypothetical protein
MAAWLSALRTGRALLPRQHFSASDIKPQGLVWPKFLGNPKHSPHQVSNPQLPGLYHSALTMYKRCIKFGSFVDRKIFSDLNDQNMYFFFLSLHILKKKWK